jgi:hypothetical protein
VVTRTLAYLDNINIIIYSILLMLRLFSKREAEAKSLPDLPSGAVQSVRDYARRSGIDPIGEPGKAPDPATLTIGDETLQLSLEPIGRPALGIYTFVVGGAHASVNFHRNREDLGSQGLGIPVIAARTAQVRDFSWAEIELISSHNPGKGQGTLTVCGVDSMISAAAQNSGRAIFAFADDDSRPRGWTTAALENVGYERSRRLVVPVPGRGPRLHKWYSPGVIE